MADDKQSTKPTVRPAKLGHSSVFVSYRRDDTSGEAGRLAADLRRRFGRESVFIDIDMIAPGVDFETEINRALDVCRVTFVLIGKRWLNTSFPDGARRLDDERDYVRHEIAAALRRPGMDVVPVLIEGAVMPNADQLPEDIKELSKRDALELSNKRWRYDVGQLYTAAARYNPRYSRLLKNPRFWAIAVTLIALAGAGAFVITNSGTGGNGTSGNGTSGNGTSGNRAILVPASVPPVVDECTRQLWTAVDGTVGPLRCPGNRINTLAWQYYAKFNPLVMTLGRFATEGKVGSTMCSDLKHSTIATIPKEEEAYQISALYYGWRSALPSNWTALGPFCPASPKYRQQQGAAALAVLLARSVSDHNSVVNAVHDINRCGPSLSQDGQIFAGAVASRRRLLSELANLPDRAALPTRMLEALTGAWEASMSADRDYARWARDEALRSRIRNDHADPGYQTALAPDGQATAGKKKFVRLWNPLARQYALTTYQWSQL